MVRYGIQSILYNIDGIPIDGILIGYRALRSLGFEGPASKLFREIAGNFQGHQHQFPRRFQFLVLRAHLKLRGVREVGVVHSQVLELLLLLKARTIRDWRARATDSLSFQGQPCFFFFNAKNSFPHFIVSRTHTLSPCPFNYASVLDGGWALMNFDRHAWRS